MGEKKGIEMETNSSSMLGWKILFIKPMLGDLKGYWSGSSTWIFQTPPANGAVISKGGVGIRREGNRVNGDRTMIYLESKGGHTFSWTIEPDIELLHAIVYEVYLVIRHEPTHSTHAS